MVLTIYGAAAVSFMMVAYALESKSPHFIAAFALGCALSSSYGFLAGTWPFGAVEAIWSLSRHCAATTRHARAKCQP